MFQRLCQYALVEAGGQWYRPRGYGDPRADGRWDGWLILVPLLGGDAIAPPHSETTQTTWTALTAWSQSLTPVYLEGALERARIVAQQPPAIISRLAVAEYEALQDAERLETAAVVERTAADLDDAAANAVRDEADQIRRERLAAERALSEADEAAANVEAAIHEQAARDAREAAARAVRRRRSAETGAAPARDRRRATKKTMKKR